MEFASSVQLHISALCIVLGSQNYSTESQVSIRVKRGIMLPHTVRV